ncbi:unnamed protein product [[Candida] boidinii]|nr:unnamed protein product [[Candida] boidinii]
MEDDEEENEEDNDDENDDIENIETGEPDEENDWEVFNPNDVSRMTERQRAKYFEEHVQDSDSGFGDFDDGNLSSSNMSDTDTKKRKIPHALLALSNNPTKKKQLTEEEQQLRRLETARKQELLKLEI